MRQVARGNLQFLQDVFVEFETPSRMVKVQQASHEISLIDTMATENHDYGLNTKQCVYANPIHFLNFALPITGDVHM